MGSVLFTAVLLVSYDLWMFYFAKLLQTQHKTEMDKRDGKFGPQPAMAVPQVQQMSRLDQPYPASVGYTGYPPPAYGQPAYPPHPQAGGYPPPQQATGYPPAGYPPAGYPPTGYQG